MQIGRRMGASAADPAAMTVRNVVEVPVMTPQLAEQTHECGLGKASKDGPVFSVGRSIGVNTSLYLRSVRGDGYSWPADGWNQGNPQHHSGLALWTTRCWFDDERKN